MTPCRQIVTSLFFFKIYGQFGAIRKTDCGCLVCKTYIFINNNLLSYKNIRETCRKPKILILNILFSSGLAWIAELKITEVELKVTMKILIIY